MSQDHRPPSRPVQIAFLTGQSNPRSCALSPEQHAFLDALPAAEAAKVRRNFPFMAEGEPHRAVPLPVASWHNTRLWLSTTRRAFAARYRAPVLAQLAQADRTILLAGSSGLQLLAAAALPDEALARLHVFAYGPVARRRLACEVRIVQGRDWVSRLLGRTGTAPVSRVGCGHLGYLRDRDVQRFAADFVSDVLTRATR